MNIQEMLMAGVAEEARSTKHTNIKPKVGDHVIITEPGHTYETYKEKFRELGFQNPNEEHPGPAQPGIEGVVFAITQHKTWSEIVMVAVRNKFGQEWLVQDTGVGVVEDNSAPRTFTKFTISEGVTYNEDSREFTVVDPEWFSAFSIERRDVVRIINPSTDKFGDFIVRGLDFGAEDAFILHDQLHNVTLQLKRSTSK